MTSIDTSEQFLALPDGRTLAYCESGVRESNILVLFVHGLFSVGRADRERSVFRDAGVHVVSPTLPGFGNSSDRPTTDPYAVTLANDMTALIEHVHPDDSEDLRIYIGGGSYGTVGAQILYGLPFDVFPYGKNIIGVVLLGPLSPFRYHRDYTKGMTWVNYFGVGPPSQIIPFRLIQRMVAMVMGMKFKTVEQAEMFLRKMYFKTAGEEEKANFKKWQEREGMSEGQFERVMAENAVKSTKNWSGFMEVSDVLHSDWGFEPCKLDHAHCARPIMIVAGRDDPLGSHMPTWLAENYRNSRLKWLQGGHISAAWEMDEIWKTFMEETQNNTE
ncbi:hypothetical protein Moror_11675 [Moniliophthora roreri MCA 2997]|uniref:AB hydrolase-1 domain-containing protein n=2 Tax=Moniliophthora roreri TaxID=221103 RepID=V2X4M4_MONRO|nr:hypothetical protein Moror_11675 [Moniliophthora roreri MCA 2997]KAI3619669.1 hypothetical protein WG66_002718 [Moniliophthora roreri]